jgi:predicted Zn finger-like uncharacterized protein
MIIGCPGCHTRYLVDEQALGGRAGRTVRCATCGHTWHQAAPPELVPVDERSRIEPALEVPPRPKVVAEESLGVPPRPGATSEPPAPPRRSRWAALRWLLLVMLVVLAILAGGILARGAVVSIWPSAARLFALAGLPVDPLGAGLKPNQ